MDFPPILIADPEQNGPQPSLLLTHTTVRLSNLVDWV
ncbi:hypothetical protein NC651_040257 [Populus alba x Populus x berolinensis]|nr:hypothetical protein NC651_040257 [Populus alba x Populus x berolinensis]